MDTRMKAACRKPIDPTKDSDGHSKIDEHDERCRHVRATPNNPESSRGHLFTILDVNFAGDKNGKIVVVDCAGSEDPVSIMKDYVVFAHKDDGTDAAGREKGDRRAAMYLKRYNEGEEDVKRSS